MHWKLESVQPRNWQYQLSIVSSLQLKKCTLIFARTYISRVFLRNLKTHSITYKVGNFRNQASDFVGGFDILVTVRGAMDSKISETKAASCCFKERIWFHKWLEKCFNFYSVSGFAGFRKFWSHTDVWFTRLMQFMATGFRHFWNHEFSPSFPKRKEKGSFLMIILSFKSMKQRAHTRFYNLSAKLTKI